MTDYTNCMWCGEKFKKHKHQKRNKNKYCSTECYGYSRTGHDKRPDKETLETLYHIEKQTQKEIADKYNVDPSCVRKWMKKHSITPRTKSEAMKQMWAAGKR